MSTIKDKRNINIVINGRTYPFIVDGDEQEEIYRKAAKSVEETLKTYREKNYKNFDTEAYLGLVAFQYALGKIVLEQKQDISVFIEEIEKINDKLNDYLSNE